MDGERMVEILEKIRTVRVAIYGDFCLDAYWHMARSSPEVSVETGIHAEALEKQHYNLGGAANVAANIAALNPEHIELIGIIGDDIFGEELRRKLREIGTNPNTLTVQENNFNTYVYIKKILDGKEGVRVDFGTNNIRSLDTDAEIIGKLRYALQNCDVLIFNQQIPGNLNNQSFIDEANQLFKEFNDKVVVLDSRHYGNKFKNVFHKTNDRELALLGGTIAKPIDKPSISQISDQAIKVHSKSGKPVFVTLGENGILIIDLGKIMQARGIHLVNQVDLVGAGDTVLSVLSLALAAGISPYEAAEVANLAAAVTVQKLMTTGTASAKEIIKMNEEANLIYNPELANDPRKANYYPGTEVEVCDGGIYNDLGNLKHIVFDYDGTISTARQGWEKIMELMMVRAILGDQYESTAANLFEKVRKRVAEFIDLSTGIQTIVQMQGLVDMVHHFDCVPKGKILDKFEYKKIFNESLLKMVCERMAKFESGQLNLDDLTVKGAVDFLSVLREKGVTLYLASGTDRVDILKEVKSLGIAELFSGGIYGSVGDVSKYSKKMVVGNIIRDNGLKGNELAVFGDGPAEIQVCRRLGGIPVGIASDEVRRYGLNLEKRTRLIKSGARIVIPDFSYLSKLIELLFASQKHGIT